MDNTKLLQQFETCFKQTINWNKYISDITNQVKSNNLQYLIDPMFHKFNRLFVLSFENKNNIRSYSNYDVPIVDIKDYNALIDCQNFF